MNKTIETQLNHKSIRSFTEEPIKGAVITQLVDVAQHTSTSNFMQSYSIISVTDPEKKEQIANIGNQPYIAQTGHLFIFVIDQHRNKCIAQAKGLIDTDVLTTFDRFMIGYSDALLAAQNVMVAAESMGLGGVFLGSILNQSDDVIKLLNLPKGVFPVIGLGIGYPNQSPQLKPRLPQSLIHFENTYPEFTSILEELEEYDEEVSQYYDLRDSNTRIDSFTNQIAQSMSRKHPGRMRLKSIIQDQDLAIK